MCTGLLRTGQALWWKGLEPVARILSHPGVNRGPSKRGTDSIRDRRQIHPPLGLGGKFARRVPYMNDVLIRGVFPESSIRFAVCSADGLCSHAVHIHGADRLSGWLLSEALVCSTLLSTTLKHGEKITLRWMYDGAVGTILADMTEASEVRGFTQRKRLLPEVETLAAATGITGKITAVTSTPTERLRTGITESVYQNVPRDLAFFLSLSFQVETALAVGLVMPRRERAEVASALGLMLQPMPGCEPSRFEKARQSMEHLRFQTWLEEGAHPLEAVLAQVGLDETANIYSETRPLYSCQCSRNKADTVLRMFDPSELREMLESDGQAEVNCHFCATRYVFSGGELQVILGQSQAGNA